MTLVSTLGQSLDQVERLKVMQLQLASLQTQIATGKKTQLFKGLGTDVIASERAREGISRLDNYINNIDIVDRRLKLMIGAMNEMKNQAESVLNAIEIQTQQGEYEIGAVSNLARNTASFLRDLVNTKDGDRYLFGGSETTTAPLSNTGTMQTYMVTQLTSWTNAAIDTDQLVSSYNDRMALTDTIIGYSAPLSSGTAKNVYVRVENMTEIDYTVYANSGGMRDIITGVNMMAQIDQVLDKVTLESGDPVGTVTAPGATKQEQNDNFYQFFNDMAAMLNRALDSMDSELYALSQSQAQISKIKESHKLDKNIFADIINQVEDADMNEVAVKLNSLQIQLEASYRVTASISSLSLVNFLG
ncbi:MAG: hypothetical protein CO093_06795 [Alphaproteobacteria bacterium CG_4_9_14_3_um_filter_47_13]|nr:MAG: hypothetical protein CO093_06795 [Alphaproteobacteria bacterium CG_4_9_14_3_um_filter_47_13]